ncbi:alpha/beta hydrolase fold-1, partial [Tanacetum coccineum]
QGTCKSKIRDPHKNVGKLEKDGDKAMNEEIERKTVKKITHESKGWQKLCPNKPKAMKISKEGRNGIRRLKKTKIYRFVKARWRRDKKGLYKKARLYFDPGFSSMWFLVINCTPTKDGRSKKNKRENFEKEIKDRFQVLMNTLGKHDPGYRRCCNRSSWVVTQQVRIGVRSLLGTCACLGLIRVKALVNLSVPFFPWSPMGDLIQMMRAVYGEDHYMVRFQEPGDIEAELAQIDVKTVVIKFFAFREPGPFYFPRGKGFHYSPNDAPVTLPPWLSEDDVEYFTSKFEKSGFTGGVN